MAKQLEPILGRKEIIRGMAKKSLDILFKSYIIEGNHTGKVTIEMNLNHGQLTSVKILPEIHG